MSIWIELMCDVRTGGTDPKNILVNRCWTDRNENVTGRACNVSTLGRTLRLLSKEAKQLGWVRGLDGGWTCPGCKEKT